MNHRTCRACPNDISHLISRAIYCSNACRRWVANGNTEQRIPATHCEFCGEPFSGKIITARFCTRKCKMAAAEKRRVRDDAARYLKEREYRIESALAYAKANPHVGQATKRKRKALMSGADSFQFTPSDWLALKRRFSFCCAYCGERERLTMDHVVPLVRGGAHSIGNILPACQSCNCTKQGRFVSEWKHGRSRKASRR